MGERRAIPQDWRRWREWPLVVLSISDLHRHARHRIVELARERSWRLLDLKHFGDRLQPGFRVSGALLEQLPDDPRVRLLRRLRCPLVRIGRFADPGDDVVPAVIEDYALAGRMAAEHFSERNFRHVGFVGYDPLSDYEPLFLGLRARAEALGLKCHLLTYRQLPASGWSSSRRQRFRQREFSEWILQVPKPIGLLGFSNNMAARMCMLSVEAGLEVPAEVAVLGHGDDIETGECAPLPLSTIVPGSARQGEVAMELLAELMAGNPPPGATVFVAPGGIVARESTDVLATTNPAVRQALRLLWGRYDEDLSVDEIADAVGVRRRSLERCFRQELGRGVAAELNRWRLERCAELLRETPLTVTEIAPRVGFHSKEYLHAAFRRAYGMTPRTYRVRNAGSTAR